jgi:hypothetical protein
VIKFSLEMVLLMVIASACLILALSILFVHLWPVFLLVGAAIWYYKHKHPKEITKCPDCELKEVTRTCGHRQ